MRTLILAGLMGLTLLTGCARRYVITLSSGSRIETKGKPKLDGNVYRYKDISGAAGAVSRLRVREIAPASMAGSPSSSGFKATPKK